MQNNDYSKLRTHKAYNYAKDVVNGDIVASKYVKKACQSFLYMVDDESHRLHKKYFVCIKTFGKIDKIIRLTNFATGEYAGQSCYEHIEGFQWFILMNLYAVKHRDNPRKRRYEKACVFIARKNAKTWLVSMFMLLGLLFEPNYAQLVAAANTREQARILFNEIKKTLEVSPHLLEFFKITTGNIKCKLNNNILFPIAAEARNTDGMLVSLGCVDEYGAARDDSIYQSIQTSMLSTINRLLFTISTGYPYPNNPMKEQIEYGKKVLDEVIEDDRFFLMCYELDEKDDWTDSKVWIKSNPLQANSKLGMEFLEGECKMALEMPSKQVAFRTKNLNQWLDGDSTQVYIPIEDVKKCRIDSYDWTDREVYIGIDLAQTTDNCAVSMVTYDEYLDKYIIKAWGFIPDGNAFEKSKVEKIDYNLFKELNYCYFCGDKVVDYSYIENFILQLEDKYRVRIKSIAYDRYNCISTATKLSNLGYETIEIRQNSSVLHSGTKLLKESVLTNKVGYETNSLLEINFANAREMEDSNLKTFLNKKKSTGKIDLVASIINCFVLIHTDYIDVSVYETESREEGFLIL